MKIAIITEGYLPELNGVTVSLRQRLKRFSEWGHRVILYAPDYSPVKHIYPNHKDHIGEVMPGIQVIPFPSKPYYTEQTRDPKPFSFKRVEKSLVSFKPDIIHAECPERLFMGFYARPGIKIAKKLGIPATAIYHTNYLDYIDDYKNSVAFLRIPGMARMLKKMVVWVYNSYDLTMVPSRNTANYLKSNGVKNTCHNHFNGVDLDIFKPKPILFPAELETFKDKVTILYIGRLTPDKDIKTLLQIFSLVYNQSDKCAFVIIGAGQEEERVEKWVSKHGGRAIFLKSVPHEETPAYYQTADIFVTASEKENNPLTIMEAMACGVPVVGPDEKGVGELTQNGKTGLTVSRGGAKLLAEAVLKLASDSSARLAMKAEAIKAAKNLSWEKGAMNMLETWKSLTPNSQ